MADRKTQASPANADDYIDAIADDQRRADCRALVALMAAATKEPAVMWGTSIVGFGVRSYALASGKPGQICSVGFSSRKGDISVYGLTRAANAGELFAQLGKHRLGQDCLTLKRLSDVDPAVLAQLVARAHEAST